jgi:hypothetical protein
MKGAHCGDYHRWNDWHWQRRRLPRCCMRKLEPPRLLRESVKDNKVLAAISIPRAKEDLQKYRRYPFLLQLNFLASRVIHAIKKALLDE